jgi:hypothetical protein
MRDRWSKASRTREVLAFNVTLAPSEPHLLPALLFKHASVEAPQRCCAELVIAQFQASTQSRTDVSEALLHAVMQRRVVNA